MADALPETDRLIFREMTNDDLADVQRMFADEYALRFYPSMVDIDEVQRWIDWSIGTATRWKLRSPHCAMGSQRPMRRQSFR